MFRAFLDDDANGMRPVSNDFNVIWFSSAQAINWMEENGCPAFISFDHDLGMEYTPYPSYDTGMKVVKWMVNKAIETGNFFPLSFDYIVHSHNFGGAQNIDRYLSQYIILNVNPNFEIRNRCIPYNHGD